VDGLVQHGLQGLAGAFGQAFADDEQLGFAPGCRWVCFTGLSRPGRASLRRPTVEVLVGVFDHLA
jgi:hypothetical protein